MDDDNSDIINSNEFEKQTLSTHNRQDSVCESHNLTVELPHLSPTPLSGEEDSKSFRRTEKSLIDLETQLNNLSSIKKLLSEQFTEEKNAIIVNYGKTIRGLRSKHYICESSFKSELETVKLNCKKLEEKRAADVKSFREKIDFYVNENEKIKRQAESTKQELENDITEKEKIIRDLENDNSKQKSRIKLLEEEHKNRKQEYDNKLYQYQINQNEDNLKIEQLKDELDNSKQEILHIQSEFEDLTEQYKQSEEINLKLQEESYKVKEQLKTEESAKQEKIEVIHSLTTTLNENRSEIERLRKNFAELELTRISEVKELQTELTSKEANFEQELREINNGKFQIELKLKEEVTELKESLRESKNECDNLKISSDQKNNEFQIHRQQHERKIQKLNFEKESLNDKIIRLEEQNVDLNNKLTELNSNFDLSQREMNKIKNLLIAAESERDKRKDEFFHAQENYRELEMNYSLVKSELEEVKHFLDTEKAFNKEKSLQIADLKDSLLSSQTEIEELKNDSDKFKRSNRDQEDLLRSLEKDRDELKNILMESEKSRIDFKTKLNNSKYSCLSIENKLKLKEDEVTNLNRRVETLNQERKLLFDELESAGKSLTQMKQLNEKLHEQTLNLQKKNSSLESKKLETDQKYTSSIYSDKDFEIRRIKRENEQLKDRILKLESEKRRVERSYANLEKDYSTLKSTPRPSTLQKRTPSPHINNRIQSDQSSILSFTRLLSDTNFGNSSKLDVFSDEAMKVTRGIEALEQQHLEIQQKVLGLENLIDAASSESDLNTTKRSEDFSDIKLIDIGSVRSANLDSVDYNGNYNDVDEKLKMAQLKAQNLIDSSSMFEKEIVKSSRSRTHFQHHHDAMRSEDELDQ